MILAEILLKEEEEKKNILSLALPFLKKWEGYEKTIYKDIGGIETVGYGFTDPQILKKYANGISEKQAEVELANILLNNLHQIKKILSETKLNHHQLAALLSFTYNIGINAFQRSTLCKVIRANPNDKQGVTEQFLRWKYVNKQEVRGLLNRRKAEVDLYFGT